MKQYKITINGNLYEVAVESVSGDGKAAVTVNGKKLDVAVETAGGTEASSARPVSPLMTSAPLPSAASAPAVQQLQPQASSAPASQPVSGTDVTSPLPGVIVAVSVNVGDKVSAGQGVATLEAMKMENVIEAETDGIVKAIHVQKGDSVLEGDRIVTIG